MSEDKARNICLGLCVCLMCVWACSDERARCYTFELNVCFQADTVHFCVLTWSALLWSQHKMCAFKCVGRVLRDAQVQLYECTYLKTWVHANMTGRFCMGSPPSQISRFCQSKCVRTCAIAMQRWYLQGI